MSLILLRVLFKVMPILNKLSKNRINIADLEAFQTEATGLTRAIRKKRILFFIISVKKNRKNYQKKLSMKDSSKKTKMLKAKNY